MEKNEIRVAITVISDRVSRGEMVDRTGPRLKELAEESGWKIVSVAPAPDDRAKIEAELTELAASGLVRLILTAGGTGLGPRDVTPEATRAVIEKEIDGLELVMRSEGLKKTPRAALSRGVAGVAGKCLIVNLPGSVRGAEESFVAVREILPHALAMLGGEGHPEQES